MKTILYIGSMAMIFAGAWILSSIGIEQNNGMGHKWVGFVFIGVGTFVFVFDLFYEMINLWYVKGETKDEAKKLLNEKEKQIKTISLPIWNSVNLTISYKKSADKIHQH